MEILINQPWYAMLAEVVMFANTVTMAMPSRWRDNNFMNYISKGLNFLALNIFKNRNMDDIP